MLWENSGIAPIESTCLEFHFERAVDWRRSQDISVGRRSSFLPAFFVPRAIAQEETRFYNGVNVDSHRFVEPAATTPQEAVANTTVPLIVGMSWRRSLSCSSRGS